MRCDSDTEAQHLKMVTRKKHCSILENDHPFTIVLKQVSSSAVTDLSRLCQTNRGCAPCAFSTNWLLQLRNRSMMACSRRGTQGSAGAERSILRF